MRLRPILMPTALALALAACAGTPEPTAEELGPFAQEPAPPPAMDEPAPPTPEEPPMDCKLDTLGWTKGQLADEALVAKAKAEAGAERVRVIKPGMAVTMDYRGDRLNIDVDADNRVTRVHCG